MAVFTKKDREVVGTATMVFALLAALLAFAALVTAAHAESQSGGGGSAAATGVPVQLTEFKVSPSLISVEVGGKLAITNAGTVVHNATVEGTDKKTKDLQPGESATLDLGDLKEGMYNLICGIPGHKEAGMTAMLHVGASGAAAASGGVDPAALLASNDKSDETMTAAVAPYLTAIKTGKPATKGVGNSGMKPMTPKIEGDAKVFNLTAAITDWEVSPGKTVKAWTYNGTVPGPWIKVNPNDHVKIVLKNDLPQSTAIHFHGIETPFEMDGVPDVTQAAVKPGATFTYDFIAKGPAMGMYHSHHHAEHQVPDGLVGVFEVGDMPLPAGVGPVTQEVPMVLNDAGVIGLSLNGKSFPATAPVIGHVGDTVEITYFNEGLQIHPMHLHGIPQLVVAKDGFALPAPYYADTVTVAPGERFTVIVRPDASKLSKKPNAITHVPTGIWAFHCHILTHAEGENGMFGMVTTFIVLPKA